MTYRFVPNARDELDEAIEWYRLRNEEIAIHFTNAIETAIERILAHPLIYRVRKSKARFCQVDIFPYHLIFNIHHDEIIILALAHTSRKPSYWQDRLA